MMVNTVKYVVTHPPMQNPKPKQVRLEWGQLVVKPAVCLSDPYDVFLIDIVKDTKQNLWTMIYRSQ